MSKEEIKDLCMELYLKFGERRFALDLAPWLWLHTHDLVEVAPDAFMIYILTPKALKLIREE